MAEPYRIIVMRKNDKTITSITPGPIKEIYAMLYSAIALVSQNTNTSVEHTLAVLADLHQFVQETGQGPEE